MASNMKILIFCTVLVFICGPCSSNEIIDEIATCKFGPDFDECIRDTLNNIFPKLRNGDKELGILPTDPLSIPYMSFEQKASGAIQVKQEYHNNLVHNFSNSTYTKVNFDMENSTIAIEIFNPEIALVGTYKLNGKILQLPVHGGGAYSVVIDKLVTKYRTKFEKVNRDGDIYWHFIKSWGHFYPAKITMKAENIIDGQKELSDQLVAMINENWRDLYQEIERPFTSFMGKVMTEILNKLFAKLPIKKAFESD